MGPPLIVIDPPRFQLRVGVGQRDKLVDVEAFVAEPTVKRFDVRILNGFARVNEVELHPVSIGPVLERAGQKLGAMIHGDRARRGTGPDRAIEGGRDVPTGQAQAALQQWALTTPLIDDREHAKRPPIGELIGARSA